MGRPGRDSPAPTTVTDPKGLTEMTTEDLPALAAAWTEATP